MKRRKILTLIPETKNIQIIKKGGKKVKKIGLFLVMFMVFTSLVYARPVRDAYQTGFAITPQTKTHEDHNAIETDTVVWTPESGKKIVLMGVAYWSDTLGNFFVETGSTKVIPNAGICVASGVTVIDGGYPIWRGATDATLTYTTAIESDHSILLWGFEEN